MLVPVELIEGKIPFIRGQKVMLDRDLAVLYGVETRALNQAVSRNIERFPEDFMLRLTREEIMRLSQFVICLGASGAGAFYGEEGIPEDWREKVSHHELIVSYGEKLLCHDRERSAP